MAPRPLAIERAARRDLKELKLYSDSGLARSYLLLARELDLGGLAARDAAAVAREMRLVFLALHDLSPSGEDGDYADEFTKRREARMQGGTR